MRLPSRVLGAYSGAGNLLENDFSAETLSFGFVSRASSQTDFETRVVFVNASNACITCRNFFCCTSARVYSFVPCKSLFAVFILNNHIKDVNDV